MKNKEAICEMLEEQEREILKKGSMDERDLKILYRLSAIVTDYETREAMKKAEGKGGYSHHYPPHMWMDGMSEGSYEGSYDGSSMRMSHEASQRRGRDANTGRYVSCGGSYDGAYEGSYDRGYSRGESDEQFKEGLRQLMNKARTEEERNIVRNGLNLLS